MPTTGTSDQPRGRTALLIIDMINPMDFEGAEAIGGSAQQAAGHIAALADQARAASVPVIYVNDNFGQWHSERSRLVEHSRAASAAGASLVSRLGPLEDDYFIIKPMHSGFYSTNLPVLLPKLGASRLILTGMAADNCVLFTAADAHMRDYELWVPADCIAAETPARRDAALATLVNAMSARVEGTDSLSLQNWLELGKPR